MAYFTRIEIYDDVACNGGVRVAILERQHLTHARLTTALASPESLTFGTSRALDQAAEIVIGRVARVCWDDATLDTEWPISEITDQSGANDQGQVAVACQSIALALARAPFIEWEATSGDPLLAISGLQLTATEWITAYVLTAATEASLYPITVGTIDYTDLFDLEGEYQTAMQLLQAILQPGRAPGELVVRRNGATDYKIDLLTAGTRGASANVVRVTTAKNLLAHERQRSLAAMATKVVPRGGADGLTRTMARAQWYATVVDGTHLDLTDPAGGAGPSFVADQLKNLYIARQAAVFSSQVVSASVATTATTTRVTVAATAAWTTGDLAEFRSTSGASGRRLASLQHPTAALASSAGGYGKVTRFLDVPAVTGDCNLVPNPRARTWTTIPDGWIVDVEDVGNTTRETTITKFDTDTLRLAHPAKVSGSGYVGSGPIQNYGTAGLLHAAHVWVYPDLPDLTITQATAGLTSITTTTTTIVAAAGSWITAGLAAGDYFFLADHSTVANNRKHGPITVLTASTITMAAGSLTADAVADTTFTVTRILPDPTVRFAVSTVPNITDYWRTASFIVEFGSLSATLPKNQWTLLVLDAIDLAAWGPVIAGIEILTPTASPTALIVAAFSLSEGADDIPDVERSGGTVLWQRANVALAALAAPVAGYTLALADLARLDGSAWSDEPLVLGGTVEVTDADLALTTSQRVVELSLDLLHPLASAVQLENAAMLASQGLAT